MLAGQLVTSGAQLVMVKTSVEYRVSVHGLGAADEDAGAATEVEEAIEVMFRGE